MAKDTKKPVKSKAKDINDIDVNIGIKISHLRLSLGMTRDELAKSIGVTHQQLQKYEKGINRITASRLVEIAKSLNVPIAYFFEDLITKISPADIKRQRLYLEMMRDFINIKEDEVQEAIRKLICVVSK